MAPITSGCVPPLLWQLENPAAAVPFVVGEVAARGIGSGALWFSSRVSIEVRHPELKLKTPAYPARVSCTSWRQKADFEFRGGAQGHLGRGRLVAELPGGGLGLDTRQYNGHTSRRRNFHFADALSPSLLKHLLMVEGVAAE